MTNKRMGLTASEATARLQKFGPNEFEEKKLATALENVFMILSDPMGLMLLILSAVYWILGKQTDSVVLLIAYIPIIGIDVLLKLRSRKALRSLKKSLQSTCHVIRDGKTISVPVRELVPGDLLVLEEGQTLPADGKLLDSSNLTIDESSVTGESVPIEKTQNTETLSGTTVLTGTGVMEIEKTGLSSQIGSIAKMLQEFEAESSPFLRLVKKAVRIIFLVSLGFGLIVFFVSLAKDRGFGASLIASLTLSMAAIPEEFPLVLTLYLSLAAYRLSKRGILVKSLPAVESLGRVDVICTDKTGTLTEGKFLLEKILSKPPTESPDALMRALVFACEPKAVDAMESSIFEWVKEKIGEETILSLHDTWTLKYDYPFEPREKYMCHIWQEKTSERQVLAMKGALEGVLPHCSAATEKAAILEVAKKEAEAGKRLLGLAYKEGNFCGDRKNDEKNLTFLGILTFTDPVRPSVPAAIRSCTERGIKLKMLTGDHLLTAHAIADKIGLPHRHDELFSGPDLEQKVAPERLAAYRKGVVFARLKPEQKLELIQALKSEGDIIAMTGDGINDAPALKLADIGISMGERATDVARSTAQIVLLKNDFGGIVNCILEGQRVLKSLNESFGYLIAFHIPIICIALFQAFFLEQPILQPIHIVLLELIVHPISAFVFMDPPNSKTTKRSALLSTENIFWSSLRGIALTSLSIFLFFYAPGSPNDRSNLAVLALILGNAGLLLGEKGGPVHAIFTQAIRALLACAILFALTAALIYVPLLSRIFSFSPPPAAHFFTLALLGLTIGVLCPFSRHQNESEMASHTT